MSNIHLIGRYAFLCVMLMHIAPAVGQTSVGNRIGITTFQQQITLVPEYAELEAALDREMGSVTGFAIAIPVEFPVTNLFAIQPEFGFLTKGYTYDVFQAVEFRMNYADLTILAKLNLGPGKLKGELFGGPGLSIGVSTRTIRTDMPMGPYYGWDQLSPFDYRAFMPVELNVTLGAGLSYSLGRPRLFVNYRYIRGLTNAYMLPFLFVTGEGNVVTELNGYNHGSMISLGILIPVSSPSPDR